METIPIAATGISAPEKIRVLIYQSNTVCHVPLTSLVSHLTERITQLEERVKTLEGKGG